MSSSAVDPKELRDVLSAEAELPEDPNAPLEVDSLTLVSLVEALEDHYGLRVPAKDVLPKNFGSLAAIAGYLASRMQGQPAP